MNFPLFSTATAEDGDYSPPQFMLGTNSELPAQYPASPLAGGLAAANGGQFMDVQGNSIVMPASYYGSGSGGGYPGGAYGDPMAVDFGGCETDQCGPHYFDVSLETVFLLPEDPFGGMGALISAGAAGPLLNVLPNNEDYDVGWRIAARYDLGPLSVIEGTYMGIYDIQFTERVVSSEVVPGNLPNSIFTRFSNFGIPTPIATLDDADVVTFGYDSDLQSTEFSYRRYWMAYNSRVTGTFLMGARYLRMTEGFSWDTVADDPVSGNPVDQAFSSQTTTSENDLLGFQLGGDGWLTLRQGLRVGTETKAGVYNNRYKINKSGVFDPIGNAPADFAIQSEGNQVSFAAESEVSFVADILPSWSIRGGYQVLYLSSLATVGDNIDTVTIGSAANSTQGYALYHGFHGGVEYVW